MIRTIPKTAQDADAMVQLLLLVDLFEHIESITYVGSVFTSMGNGSIRKRGIVVGPSVHSGNEITLVVAQTPPIGGDRLKHDVSHWFDTAVSRWAFELSVPYHALGEIDL